MDPSEWDDVARVLAVRLDNIGDVILLGPALRSLRLHAPHASISLLTSPAGTAVAPLMPWVDEVITYRAEWQSVHGYGRHDPGATEDLVRTLAKGSFDAAVIFTSFSQSPHPPAMAAYLAGIPRRLGQSKEFGGALLTHWVTPLDDAQHQADRNLYLMATAGVPPLEPRLELHLPDEVGAGLASLLATRGVHDEPLVVAVPGASCHARRYDPERFAQALALLADSGDFRVVVAGSDSERWMADLATLASPRVISLAGLTSVPEFAALIERASLVICANSSALHFADAFETPVLALYSGAEDTEQWRPRNTPAVLLNRYTECTPCHRFDCPKHLACLDIPPERLAEKALAMLAGTGMQRAAARRVSAELVSS